MSSLPAATDAPDGGAGSDPGSSVPFEDASRPFLSRLLATVGLAFSNPARLFSNLPSGDIGAPVLYGLIVGTLAIWLGLLWQVMLGGLLGIAGEIPLDELVLETGFWGVFSVFAPMLVLAGMFITGGIYHLMLLLLGDGSRGFGVTLSAVTYGSTPNLLAVVPICGGIIGGIWAMVLIMMAASHGHRTDVWRVVVAYFLPLLVCCGLLFFMGMMAGILGAALAR